MLSAIAILSATLTYVEYVRIGDVRWIIGGTVILANWPYSYFVMTPVNIWLCATAPDARRSPARELLRDWVCSNGDRQPSVAWREVPRLGVFLASLSSSVPWLKPLERERMSKDRNPQCPIARPQR